MARIMTMVEWWNAMSVMLLLIFGFAMRPTEGQLQYGYYDTTCPDAEEIARTALHLYFTTDLTSPASILRVSFHDCQVQVMKTLRSLACTASSVCSLEFSSLGSTS